MQCQAHSRCNDDGGDQYTGLDRFGRVADQRWINTSTSTATDRFQYGYDRDGNVLYKNNLVNSSFSELYHANGASNGYDNLNQLTAFARGALNGGNDTISSPSATNSWATDALGNFTTLSGQTETNNKQNEATAFGSATLTYDSNGNLTTDQNGKALVYDAWNRLVAYKNGGTTLETLAYDGLGRRIVENPGTANDLYYSKDWQVLEERQGGTAKDQYVWSPVYVDALVLRDRDSTGGGTLNERLWAQQDANYNVTALVNGSGSVVERYVYDPYGARTVLNASWTVLSGSAYASIYGHQGTRLDAVTGLYGERERDLSPALDRWAEPDPTGFGAGDPSFYRVEGNHPLSTTDPSGLQELDAHYGQQIATAYYRSTLQQAIYGARCGLSVNPGLAVLQAVNAYNGYVKSFNTWLTNNPPSSWGVKQQPQLIEERAPLPNSTLMQSWDQTFDGFRGQRQTAFHQIYYLALFGMMWTASGPSFTTPAGDSFLLSGGRFINPKTGEAATAVEEAAANKAFAEATEALRDRIAVLEDKIASIQAAEYGYGPHRVVGSEQELKELTTQLAYLLRSAEESKHSDIRIPRNRPDFATIRLLSSALRSSSKQTEMSGHHERALTNS